MKSTLATAALALALAACTGAASPATETAGKGESSAPAAPAAPVTAPASAPAEPPPAAAAPAPPVAATKPAESPDGTPRITIAEAVALRDAGKAVIVDVRDAGSYANGHVAGALSIPLAEIESRLAELPRDKRIITYCS
jgi:hypothetical protein